jgi:hypothetical protein
MSGKKLELSRWDMVYGEVMALYAALVDSQDFKVRRAEMKQGEVKAEPLDFVMDVDLKAARYLGRSGVGFIWGRVVQDPEYLKAPEYLNVREGLGEVFFLSNLGIEGHYKTLYFRTKNKKE